MLQNLILVTKYYNISGSIRKKKNYYVLKTICKYGSVVVSETINFLFTITYNMND